MLTTVLGPHALRVSSIALGTMTFGAETDANESRRILDTYVEHGGNFIDTADVYSDGACEKILGPWLKRHPEVLVATKGRFEVSGQPGWGLSAAYLTRALDASLARLGVDSVHLYQVHGPDRRVQPAELAAFFADALESGRVSTVGVSNLPGWQLALVAQLLNDPRLISHQVQYNLLAREIEWEIMPAALDAGLQCLAWGPLASGWLTGKYRKGESPAWNTRLGEDPNRGVEAWAKRDNSHTWSILGTLQLEAGRLGCTMPGLALTWLLDRPGVACAIIGARTAIQLSQVLASHADTAYDDQARQALDQVSAPCTPDYPYGFFAEVDWQGSQRSTPTLPRRSGGPGF
jgi:aryl-alcohol dehydrogenase-like predicted oxidoreductase